MAGSIWEEQFRVFLKRAGEDLKRMGDDIRSEAQRLVTEMKDPEQQKKVREGLRDVGQWARRTANDVADLVEKGAQKAEAAFRNLTEEEEKKEEQPAAEAPRPSPRASRPEPTARATSAAGAKKSATRKTAAPKKKTTRTAAPKKSIGRKPRT